MRTKTRRIKNRMIEKSILVIEKISQQWIKTRKWRPMKMRRTKRAMTSNFLIRTRGMNKKISLKSRRLMKKKCHLIGTKMMIFPIRKRQVKSRAKSMKKCKV